MNPCLRQKESPIFFGMSTAPSFLGMVVRLRADPPGPDVWIPEEDVERARPIVEDLQKSIRERNDEPADRIAHDGE